MFVLINDDFLILKIFVVKCWKFKKYEKLGILVYLLYYVLLFMLKYKIVDIYGIFGCKFCINILIYCYYIFRVYVFFMGFL